MPAPLRSTPVSRRHFLKTTTLALGSLVANHSLAAVLASKGDVALIVRPDDALARSTAPQWALDELKRALTAQGSIVRVLAALTEARPAEFCILVTDLARPAATTLLNRHHVTVPTEPESLCLLQAEENGRPVLLAAGSDARGVVYALTELADRVRSVSNRQEVLDFAAPEIERPASRVRSLLRGFNSETEDLGWFHDRDSWRAYLDLLAYSRINQLHFATGMAYNLAQNITDGFLLFPYPFLLDVPGHHVRAQGLSDVERDRNLATVRFIGEECARRAIAFQFGIWTLAYHWPRSPEATYRIEGLTDATHPAYCHDALALLLKKVPTITGVTFRVHEESGIPRGQGSFWGTQFRAIARCGRRVGIDMHAKSMSPETLEIALATGQPVTVSPKYGGEHQPLPYHQAAIRRREMTRAGALQDTGEGILVGDRGFTRYGYADTLAENRTWDVLFRIWPGSQRFLLSGDPATLAGYGRQAAFCGAAGTELSEPLHFKGRRGSGLPGGRCAYADALLHPAHDFDKYRYFYRLWGRLGYNPDSSPEVWRRELRREFGPAADAIERALAPVGRVLPLITTAHGPSADCVRYWPEIYTNIPIEETKVPRPSYDMHDPKLFGNVSPFDPQLFQSADECGATLLYGPETGQYTPLEVAQWLEQIATEAFAALAEARRQLGAQATEPEFRRIEEDVLILGGIAKFFAGKFRAAVLWRVHMFSGNRDAGQAALTQLTAARDAWAGMAQRAAKTYRQNITYGEAQTSGHWLDQLPSIEAELAELKHTFDAKEYSADQLHADSSARAVREATAKPARPAVIVDHTPPARFQAGRPLPLTFATTETRVTQVRLHYRHVNQAEYWDSQNLTGTGGRFLGEIPAAYTAGRFPLQYYFELFTADAGATLHPALEADLANTPYFVVRRAT